MKMKKQRKNKCIDCKREICEDAVRCRSCCKKGNLSSRGMLGKISKKRGKSFEELYGENAKEIRNKISQGTIKGMDNNRVRKILSDYVKINNKKYPNYGRRGKLNSKETKKKIRKKVNWIMQNTNMKQVISSLLFKYWEEHSEKKEQLKEFMNKPNIKEMIRQRVLETIPRGENHPNWLGGISFLPYDKNFTSVFKRLIILRDNCCLVCGIEKKLVVHHVDYNKLNTVKENCCALCNSCNTKANFNRKQWTQFFHSLLFEKYKYGYVVKEVESGRSVL